MNVVVAVKVSSLQRCVARAREAYRLAGAGFANDPNLQDAAVLNIIRACESAIDLANMAVRDKHLGVPAETRQSFAILEREGYVTSESSLRLRAMVGFRNLAVHQYREIDFAIVKSILERDLDDLLAFGEVIRGILDPAK